MGNKYIFVNLKVFEELFTFMQKTNSSSQDGYEDFETKFDLTTIRKIKWTANNYYIDGKDTKKYEMI